MAGMLYGGEGGRERLDGGEGGGEGRRPTGWRGRVRRWLNTVGPRVHVGLLEGTLCGGVSGTALGKEPGGDRNAVGE
jgi:hypothetical protein